MLSAHKEEDTGKSQARRLEEYEEVLGIPDKVEKRKGALLVTFLHRETLTIDFSPTLFKQLLDSRGEKIAILCLGNDYRVRLVKR
ncbi:MAG: hypothetical protein QXU32_10965 [Nitrososphaerales archaeon]